MPSPEHMTVVITGASSGIGRALAVEMAGRGYALGLTARRLSLLEKLRDELQAKHGKDLRIELATLDVCQVESVVPTLHDLFGRLGGIDTIVVNAGANDVTHDREWRPGQGTQPDPDESRRCDCDDQCSHGAFPEARPGPHRQRFLAGVAAADRNPGCLLREQGRFVDVRQLGARRAQA